MSNAQNKRRELLAEAATLANGNKTQRARSLVLLGQAAQLRDELTDAQLMGMADEYSTQREQEFRNFVRYGGTPQPGEKRTAFDTVSGGALVPQGWYGGYKARLVSYSGLRAAGATVIPTDTGTAFPIATIDDSSNVGIRQAEGVAVNMNISPVAGLSTMGAWMYNTQGVILSNALAEDIGFDLDAFLQDIFAKRLGRITNTEFSNGAGGGPTGILPSLTSALTTASPTVVTMLELCSLAGAVDPAYRAPDMLPCYMFSPGVETILKATTSTLSGERLYPEMQDGKLLGYPYVLNVDMPATISATGKAIAFGSFKKAVTIREAPLLVFAARERLAEFYQSLYYAVSRQDVALTDAAAVKVITQHV